MFLIDGGWVWPRLKKRPAGQRRPHTQRGWVLDATPLCNRLSAVAGRRGSKGCTRFRLSPHPRPCGRRCDGGARSGGRGCRFVCCLCLRLLSLLGWRDFTLWRRLLHCNKTAPHLHLQQCGHGAARVQKAQQVIGIETIQHKQAPQGAS